ncbi:hypothetical protein CIRG_09333 [Coccidioides immitis RMSCC 2394]|uniref:Uncharacterized protein n=1 Tax=Coccidioides immitis RMSCC 2394 TaxID=404692 RepID=A0A0J6YS48_COCIT|nr:hypothetical protein CIRG_09333 [Coccidioides immitis RMSCC 2394]
MTNSSNQPITRSHSIPRDPLSRVTRAGMSRQKTRRKRSKSATGLAFGGRSSRRDRTSQTDHGSLGWPHRRVARPEPGILFHARPSSVRTYSVTRDNDLIMQTLQTGQTAQTFLGMPNYARSVVSPGISRPPLFFSPASTPY